MLKFHSQWRSRSHYFKAILLSVFVASVTMAASCTDRNLSRSKAAQLIKDSADFKNRRHTAAVCVGDCLQDGPGGYPIDRALQSLGYLNIGSSRRVRNLFSANAHLVLISLTSKGADASKSWKVTRQDPGYKGYPDRASSQDRGPSVEFEVIVARPELIEVTGIREPQPKIAVAGYTWKWIPNTFGKDLVNAGMKDVVPMNIEKGEASFILYDDGWRLAQQ